MANLVRRGVSTLRSSPFSAPLSARTFASSSCLSSSTKVPALADVLPDGGPIFDAKQREFREKLVSAQKQKEQQERAAARARDQQDGKERKGPLSSLIYGTQEGKELDRDIERSFSQVLARGKYVHSIVFHEVKPDKVDEYVELVGEWYPKIAQMPENKVHLVGSWRTEVGDCDTFGEFRSFHATSLKKITLMTDNPLRKTVHIWEYQRYHGYHDSLHSINGLSGSADFDRKLKTLINAKRSSLMQEFSFWPTTPPRQLGGVFELRSYTLHPGRLLEWETHWRTGLKARREVMEGVGAWFVQIGDLNTVHHLWQFANLEERRARREQSWSVEGWGDTVHKTVPLIQTMKSRILVPTSWSPVG
ncbi:MAG: hypothetical protein M1821_007806 [Bathelium mastoideum]|nr:MAG: hypothetical protein M1821_007806 [Bathelium mastoideum]